MPENSRCESYWNNIEPDVQNGGTYIVYSNAIFAEVLATQRGDLPTAVLDNGSRRTMLSKIMFS